MIHSDRVQERMKACGVSQAELARRMGVTQGAVAKVANNNPNGSSFLHKLARELQTTSEYLTGEIDDPEAGAPAEVPLDYFQRELLDLVAMLTPADKKAVMQIVRSMVGVADPKNFKGFSATVHSPKQDYRGKE